jgi:hypothetical protein
MAKIVAEDGPQTPVDACPSQIPSILGRTGKMRFSLTHRQKAITLAAKVNL